MLNRWRWGSLQRSPRPPSWIQGVLLLRLLLLREEEEREGEQPIQNAATTPTMFTIVIDPALPLSNLLMNFREYVLKLLVP